VELLGTEEDESIKSNGKCPSQSVHVECSRIRRQLEKSWPIGEQLKHNKAEDLFAWIGSCIAEVVQNGQRLWGKELPEEISLGVTFSFPMMFVKISLLLWTVLMT
jgi:hexokinase